MSLRILQALALAAVAAAVTRHDRVPAVHVVRSALFDAAGDHEHRRLAFLVNLVVHLGVREQLELDDVLGIYRCVSL